MKRLITVSAIVLASVGWVAAVASQKSATAMSGAASKWLESLSPEQRTRAVFAFDSEERLRWHFVPNELHPRKGVQIKEMSEPQRALAHALLKTGLSARGYMTATEIVALENVLQVVEGPQRRFPRDPEAYQVTVFGTPGDKNAWGWRFEGHHISIRFDVVNGQTSTSSPAFFGTNPAEVREGPQKGKRVLGMEEDAGRAMLESLTAEQRKTAIVLPEAPNEMVTANALKIDPLSPVGIVAKELSASQREKLMALIDVYAGLMTPDLASERMARLRKGGVEKIAFAWAGDTEKGKKHYYRIQGPTFLVEYDNVQNDGNHIHSVWRDFDGDFGRDLLREHLRSVPHSSPRP